jgi:hypothetical protein
MTFLKTPHNRQVAFAAPAHRRRRAGWCGRTGRSMRGAPPPPPGTPTSANILTPPAPKGGSGTAPLVGLAVRRRHRSAPASAHLPGAANVVASPLG